MATTPRLTRLVIALAVLALASPAMAQAKKAAPKEGEAQKAAPVEPPAAKKVDLPAPPPNFEYSSEGRRDPFVGLATRGDHGRGPVTRAEGVPGMLAGEVTVRGIVKARGEWVAMISGPDNKVFTVRAGNKLADGVVRSVTENSVVILQEVNDPLSLEKQREVRKFLRGGGGEVK